MGITKAQAAARLSEITGLKSILKTSKKQNTPGKKVTLAAAARSTRTRSKKTTARKGKGRVTRSQVVEVTEEDLEIEREAKLWNRRIVTNKLIAISHNMINITVGSVFNETTFCFHLELLLVHLPSIRNQLARKYGAEFYIEPAQLCQHLNRSLDPRSLAEFQSWVYNGVTLGNTVPGLATRTGGERDWAFGRDVGTPGFQNFVMEDNLNEYRENKVHWMTPESIESVFKVTKKGDRLRWLVVDVLNACFPDKKFGKAPYRMDATRWAEVCRKYDVLQEMKDRSSKKWGGEWPWDAKHQGEYMEEEESLDDLWTDHIERRVIEDELAFRAYDNPENTSLRDRIELSHFRRFESEKEAEKRQAKERAQRSKEQREAASMTVQELERLVTRRNTMRNVLWRQIELELQNTRNDKAENKVEIEKLRMEGILADEEVGQNGYRDRQVDDNEDGQEEESEVSSDTEIEGFISSDSGQDGASRRYRAGQESDEEISSATTPDNASDSDSTFTPESPAEDVVMDEVPNGGEREVFYIIMEQREDDSDATQESITYSAQNIENRLIAGYIASGIRPDEQMSHNEERLLCNAQLRTPSRSVLGKRKVRSDAKNASSSISLHWSHPRANRSKLTHRRTRLPSSPLTPIDSEDTLSAESDSPCRRPRKLAKTRH